MRWRRCTRAMRSSPVPKGYILVIDCDCGEAHLVPDDEGYQEISEYIEPAEEVTA